MLSGLELLSEVGVVAGFYRIDGGGPYAIGRAIAYAPYADVLWCETSTPDLKEAKAFAEGVHAKCPGKLLAYNCSPSFNWMAKFDDATVARFQREPGAMDYKFKFVALAGFHALDQSMFELAKAYKTDGMAAYSSLQQAEFAAENDAYQAEVKTTSSFVTSVCCSPGGSVPDPPPDERSSIGGPLPRTQA